MFGHHEVVCHYDVCIVFCRTNFRLMVGMTMTNAAALGVLTGIIVCICFVDTTRQLSLRLFALGCHTSLEGGGAFIKGGGVSTIGRGLYREGHRTHSAVLPCGHPWEKGVELTKPFDDLIPKKCVTSALTTHRQQTEWRISAWIVLPLCSKNSEKAFERWSDETKILQIWGDICFPGRHRHIREWRQWWWHRLLRSTLQRQKEHVEIYGSHHAASSLFFDTNQSEWTFHVKTQWKVFPTRRQNWIGENTEAVFFCLVEEKCSSVFFENHIQTMPPSPRLMCQWRVFVTKRRQKNWIGENTCYPSHRFQHCSFEGLGLCGNTQVQFLECSGCDHGSNFQDQERP